MAFKKVAHARWRARLVMSKETAVVCRSALFKLEHVTLRNDDRLIAFSTTLHFNFSAEIKVFSWFLYRFIVAHFRGVKPTKNAAAVVSHMTVNILSNTTSRLKSTVLTTDTRHV